MPRKKISIAEAMEMLHSVAKEEGVKLNISVEHVETTHAPSKPVKHTTAKGFKAIPLRACHRINGVAYGPGVVDVPLTLVSHLLYQDQQAVMNEEAFRSKEEKCYIILRRHDGKNEAHVGVRVDPDIFKYGIDLNMLGVDRMVSL